MNNVVPRISQVRKIRQRALKSGWCCISFKADREKQGLKLQQLSPANVCWNVQYLYKAGHGKIKKVLSTNS